MHLGEGAGTPSAHHTRRFSMTEAQKKKKKTDETVWGVLPDETRAELLSDALSDDTDIAELKLKVDKIRLIGTLHR